MPSILSTRLLALLSASALGTVPAAASANTILLYEDNSLGTAGDALDLLGLSYTTSSSASFVSDVSSGGYDLLVLDMPSTLPSGSWEAAIASHIAGGGMAIMGFWSFENRTTLETAFQCASTTDITTPQDVYAWSPSHPVFTTPYAVPSTLTWTRNNWSDDGDLLSTSSTATAIAGYSTSSSSSSGAIVVGNSDRTIYNGFLFGSYGNDDDADGVDDMVELIANEVSYVLGVACDQDGDGYNASGSCGGTDCDDTDAAINPGASESCDGIDNDCDGTTDEDDAVDASTWYADSDGDGFGDAAVDGLACNQPSGFVADDTDCDDTASTTYPGADETCDGVDNDCDGTTDEDDAIDVSTWYADTDSDGFGDAAVTDIDCSQPSGFVADDTDCDDTASTTYPGADETCDGVDNDCDGTTDEDDAIDVSTWYADTDSDGFGDAAVADIDCSQPSGFVADDTDCDDTASTTYPGADETCDGVDNDCDGTTDEDDAIDVSTWYADVDSDGFGDAAVTDIDCNQPSGFVADNTDCDDYDANSYPGAEEVPYDGIDQDCDTTDLCDADEDGFDAEECEGEDCDDEDPDVNPDAEEIWYDDVDQDCDDESDFDADSDGFDSALHEGEDCDDADPDTYPGAPDEPYDGVIQDCNEADEYDADGDGFDSSAFGGEDCDDSRSDVYPGAEEVWYDGIDQDCDENDDDQDQDGFSQDEDCDDEDAESFPGNGLLDEDCMEILLDTGDADDVDGGGTGSGPVGCSDSKGAAAVGALGLLVLGMRRRQHEP